MNRLSIKISGTVQGVGFRPFVYTLAKELGLKGYVSNTAQGVSIELEGADAGAFLQALKKAPPPLARIDSIQTAELPHIGYKDFTIIESSDSESFTHVSPDVTVCEDCLKEMMDPEDRRHLYPFINCTNCGPRYSITKRVPYDRPNTTMSSFRMCPKCEAEYNNPDDRRFHAQPNACPECGPQISLSNSRQQTVNSQQSAVDSQDSIIKAIDLLKEGKILAIKGLGGFHLACDALNENAVLRLREKKRKSNKPFALMSPDIQVIKKFCEVSAQEEGLLQDRRRPIVLLKKQSAVGSQPSEWKKLPDKIAPNNKHIGFMLPYTPLHYLLFHCPLTSHIPLPTPHFSALVMTSGNLSEEPLVADNNEALERLSGIADAFLFHNRDIFMRVDDSVVKISGKSEVRSQKQTVNSQQSSMSFVRRARGFVPEPIALTEDGPEVLACGADLKNTFTLTKGSYAIVSQHIGDMENMETVRFFEETLENLKSVYRATPSAIAHDLHPGYLSTRWAMENSRQSTTNSQQSAVSSQRSTRNSQQSAVSSQRSTTNSQQSAVGSQEKNGLSCYGIQHHYAHIASVMAENGIKEKVIGVALDGTGYGTDSNLWGGEFMLCDLQGFAREAHFKYIPLPGGESAIRECWRTAVSYAAYSYKDGARQKLEDIGFIRKYGENNIENVLKLSANKQFSPLSSGAGRLFDAAAALAGVCERNTFEGEAAIALENLVMENKYDAYDFDIIGKAPAVIDFSKTIMGVISDVAGNIAQEIISTKFHNAVAAAVKQTVEKISLESGIKTIALSGGVFQNGYLLKRVLELLTKSGFHIHTNRKVPCNDAGISLGQAYILRERLKRQSV
ncbi:MAG: carbamoyltransferase HypF [Nitrospirae bacterium]|nr:MAG: carbamoyltransferase HypF [Nitrospirota bacterium]